MIVITTGSAVDVAAIMPVMNDAFDPAFGEAWTAAQCLATLTLPGAHLQIAREHSSVIGFTLSKSVKPEEELLLIGVAKSARRQGVGRRLIDNLLVTSQNSGHETVFLEVRDGNQAQYFYQNIGFQPIGRRSDYYKCHDGFRYDAITMAIHL
jgi:[ribosomal protein S18]-alanine N-acetyltransferase